MGMRLAASLIAVMLLAFTPARGQAQQNPDGKLPVARAAEPYLFLIRDPLVHRMLKLSPDQLASLTAVNDELDLVLWTTRNQRPRRAEELTQQLIDTSRKRVDPILVEAQRKRLQQICWQLMGTRSLLQEEVIRTLQLTESQQERIRNIIDQTRQDVAQLEEQARQGEPLPPLEAKNRKLRTEEQKKILAVLQREQRMAWINLLGELFDVAQLGKLKFKAPPLHGEGEWINSPPLTMEGLKGKVVALHFWTFGCINCIHNYPCYKNWLDEFSGTDLVIVGVHTPEGKHEYDVERVRQKAAENGLSFPIVVDNEQKNWNAWGNSMWPSVYLIDKQGYVRYWWLGELNWQGADGEKKLAQRIRELLAE